MHHSTGFTHARDGLQVRRMTSDGRTAFAKREAIYIMMYVRALEAKGYGRPMMYGHPNVRVYI